MKQILSFLGANPKLIIIGIFSIVIIAFGVWINNTVKENGNLKDQIVALEKDTLQKGFQIRSLKIDTAFYIKNLKVVKWQVDSLRLFDAKMNPGLIKVLPPIDKIKRL